ncbi:DUF397 domain-containing protein [Streptomyces sp. NA04227]|uniref:DUF397 domain-containing protein n=1 Tax=Streptomyces sp. NA04227 TaxID=2742136 RepID=UPI001590FB19|nr:DUF397 domain-containing protein [Streptomyces sp. NA04227]QKW07103.1 DUF397 domain-containing protein [Streptomyces sp. NA04227]
MVSTEFVTADSSAFTGWTKSSYSGGDNGDCLEVAPGHDTVPVRDSKRAEGPVVLFPAHGWTSFVSAVKRGELSV